VPLRYGVLAAVSRCCPPVRGRLHTRYAPVRHWYCYPFDLHVLGLPLAFILSQDQTLHCKDHLYLDSFIKLTKCLRFRRISTLVHLTVVVAVCCLKSRSLLIFSSSLRQRTFSSSFATLVKTSKPYSAFPFSFFRSFFQTGLQSYYFESRLSRNFESFFSAPRPLSSQILSFFNRVAKLVISTPLVKKNFKFIFPNSLSLNYLHQLLFPLPVVWECKDAAFYPLLSTLLPNYFFLLSTLIP
jgi:hypothetical protein